jgi:hypothetical protein
VSWIPPREGTAREESRSRGMEPTDKKGQNPALQLPCRAPPDTWHLTPGTRHLAPVHRLVIQEDLICGDSD